MPESLPEPLRDAHVPDGVRSLLARLRGAGHEAFLVGGCVRDLLRGVPPMDWDVATEALPGEVQRLFPRVIPTGIQHGTVTVLVPGASVEVTTYRVEGPYVDGRRPERVEFRRDLVEDLGRRDFTFNAMAFDPLSGMFRDPFGGRGDLALGRVRCVGVAAERFGEDGLRPMRAVRFAAVLGFQLDPQTAEAIPGALPVFARVALERVRDEFLKLLLAPGAARGLGLMESTGLLAAWMPREAGALARAADVVARSPRRLEVRLAALLLECEDPAAVLERLRLPGKTVETVERLLAHPLQGEAQASSPVEIRRWLSRLGPGLSADALSLAEARPASGFSTVRDAVVQVLGEHPPLTARALALDGAGIMRVLGVGPSPRVGEATRYLLEQVLVDPRRNTPEALEALLRGWQP